MEKYTKTGLITKDGEDIECVSSEFYLTNESGFEGTLNVLNDENIQNNSISFCEKSETYYNSKIDKKHDKLFKDLFNNKEEIAKFITKYLNLKVAITKNDIEPYKTEYVTSTFESEEADVVYKMKNNKIFFLIEHQSTIDRAMPYRIQEYKMQIIRQEIDKEKIHRRDYIFPKVIAIVLYTGENVWKTPEQIEDIQAKLFGYEENNKNFNLIDVNRYTKEELLADDLITSKAMLMEKSKDTKEVIQNLNLAGDSIIEQKIELGEHFIDVLAKFILSGEAKEEAEKVLKKIKNGKVENKEMYNFERIIKNEYKKKIKEGKAMGRTEAKKEMIKNLYAMDFSIDTIVQATNMNNSEVKQILGLTD